MPQEEETIIVPPKAVQQARQVRESRPNYVGWIALLIAVYFALIVLVAFIPLSGYMKTLSLILGTLFLMDACHSIKWLVKNRYDQ